MSSANPEILILVVEDSDTDYETVTRGIQKTGRPKRLHRCVDGDEALDYLFNRELFTDAIKYPAPDIILLDLNLPGTDGRDVLEEIKSDSKLKSIPVVIMTTSNDEKDIDECYIYGANSYIQKPVTADHFDLAPE